MSVRCGSDGSRHPTLNPAVSPTLPRPHGASGIPPRTVDFPGEMRGERHLVPSHAVGRPDDQLLGGDSQELRSESTMFPMELCVREAGTNGHGPLEARSGGCLVSAFFVRLTASDTKKGGGMKAAVPRFGPNEGTQADLGVFPSRIPRDAGVL